MSSAVELAGVLADAGVILSPITIATVLRPLDIWEDEHESD